jgi:hypothetical protein
MLEKLRVDPADLAVLNAEIDSLAFEVSTIYDHLSPSGKVCAIRLAQALSQIRNRIPSSKPSISTRHA